MSSSDASAGSGHGRGEPSYRRLTAGLFAAGFATFAQVFGAQAILPVISDDLDIGASEAALMVSATTIGIAVSVLPWAWVSDRIGRTAAMKISLVFATALSLAAPLMASFEGVVALRALVGLALGAVPGVAMAYIAEEVVSRRVGVAAGLFVAGNTFGGICGRLVAGPLAEVWGWRVALVVIAGVSVLLAAAFIALIPDSRGYSRGPSLYPLRTRILFHLCDPFMVGLYLQGLLLMGAFGAVYNFLGYRLMAPPFALPAAVVSLVFVAYFAGTASSRISAGVAARYGHLPTILGGIVLMLSGLGLMLSPVLLLVLTGLVIFTVGCFSSHPVASGLTGSSAQLGRAQATALYQLSWLGGTALFGWLAGLVLDLTSWAVTVGFVSLLCVAAAVAALVLLGLCGDRRPSPPGADSP